VADIPGAVGVTGEEYHLLQAAIPA